MEINYTYFEAEDGFFVGWFDDFPEDVTQTSSRGQTRKRPFPAAPKLTN